LTPSSRKQKKRSEILQAARKLFLERGYDAVSLDDILAQVGGSKSTLYTYYGDKEGLFAATLVQICEDKLRPLLATDVSHLNPKEALNSIGRQFLLIASSEEGGAVFRTIIAESQRFPQLASHFFSSGPAVTIRLLQDNMERWQKAGHLRNGDCEAFAVQFLGLMMGNFHLKVLLGLMEPLTEKQIKAWVARGVDVFLEGTQQTHKGRA